MEEQTMKIEQAKQLTEQALDKLIQALEAGKSETLKSYLATMSRFRRYSWGNILLIAFQRPNASYVAGFNRWKELGRNVKKGEKGITILAPVTVCKQKEHDTAEEQHVLVGVKPVHVFDLEQTEGKPLPEFAAIKGDPKDYADRLKRYITELDIPLEYSRDIAPAKGISTSEKIVLLPDLPSAEEFSTLVHELAHSLLHRGERRSETTRTIRETEAEAVAFVVSSAIGLDPNSASADYIQLYHGDKQTLTESLHLIQQTSAQILTAINPGE
jgi:antirestriction protein ArdC